MGDEGWYKVLQKSHSRGPPRSLIVIIFKCSAARRAADVKDLTKSICETGLH